MKVKIVFEIGDNIAKERQVKVITENLLSIAGGLLEVEYIPLCAIGEIIGDNDDVVGTVQIEP